MLIEGKGYRAEFRDGFWEVRWDWKEEPILSQKVGQYAVPPGVRAKFKKEVDKWVAQGWLRERPVGTGAPPVPLMAMIQEAKRKVRPVLDYRKVNEFVHVSGAKADVCAGKLRE